MYGSPDTLEELTRWEASRREPECYGLPSVGGLIPLPTRRGHTPDGFFKSLRMSTSTTVHSPPLDQWKRNGATAAFSQYWMT